MFFKQYHTHTPHHNLMGGYTLTIAPRLVHYVWVSCMLQQDAEDSGKVPLYSHVDCPTLVVVDVTHTSTGKQLHVCRYRQ